MATALQEPMDMQEPPVTGTRGERARRPGAVGVFLMGWTIFTFYMTIASFRVSGAVVTVFVLLTITVALLTIGAFHSNIDVNEAGGWVGVATAAAAWYASFAGVVNETFRKSVVPTMPLAPH